MKKIFLPFIVFILLSAIGPVAGQKVVFPENLEYTFNSKTTGNSLAIDLELILDNVRIPRQGMGIFIPVIKAENGEELRLAPIVVAGPKRHKVIKRLQAYDNVVFEQTPQAFVKRKNGTAQTIPVSYVITREQWMSGSDLLLACDISGCVNCRVVSSDCLVAENIVTAAYAPRYLVSYIMPEAEVKARTESYTARINYVVDRYELLPDYKGNANVLWEIDQLIKELYSDPDLTITHHTVTGYASPEGRFQSNITLSQNRARAFMNYLQQKYNWDVSTISHDAKGEDWEGLRKAVLEHPFVPNRDEVVAIIDNNPEIAKRKRALETLAGGQVYKILLRDVYPALRRNEFEISYIARAFDVDEAREVIRTRPQLLSLNEMFLVAQSYPKDSPEFKEVFDISVRMYPDNPISKVNAAAMEIETGSVERAIERLQGLNCAEALNNLGVAYAKTGDMAEARRYFESASEAGNEAAAHNLTELEKVVEWPVSETRQLQ